MTYPSPGGDSPFEKPAANPQYGQPDYGQAPPPSYGAPDPTQPYAAPGAPQYGSQQQYLPVTPGYYPVFNSRGEQVLVPLATPGRRVATALLEFLLEIITLGIGYVIWTLFTWGKGQTPGKQITKLKYIDISTGRPATWGKSFMRDFVIRGILFYFITLFTLTIGWFIAAFMMFDQDKNYRAGWDRIADTVVVDLSNVNLD